MSWFLRLIGSLCVFAGIAVIFFGEDSSNFFPNGYKSYASDLINNKWALIIMGVILSTFGSITKVKQSIAKGKRKKGVDYNLSNANATKSGFAKMDYFAEKQQYKVKQLVDNQRGHLKELAMKVDWNPLSIGGSNFKTSSLKQIQYSRIEVIKSKGGLLFAGIFATVGFGMAIGASYIEYKDNGLTWEILITVLFGSIFAAAGLAMFYWPRPRVFDLRQGWFWAGNKSLAREHDFMKLKHSARLSEIAVIQVISEGIRRSKGGSYTSWEINLVSKDGARLNVMDHGNKESILKDAQLLGEFLGVPVWENT